MHRPLTEPDDKREEIERRMRSYAAIAFALAVDMEVQDIASRILPMLQDEVCGIALFAAGANDQQVRLFSHAGLIQLPPPDGAAGALLGGGAQALSDDMRDQVVCFEPGAAPAWLGSACRCVATVHFSTSTSSGDRWFVLFAIRAAVVGSVFSALLHLTAQRICDCLVRHGSSGRRVAASNAELPDAIKVLLIDDEPVMVAHVGRHLRRRGFGFHAAGRAQEGLEIAASIQPAVILVDKRLPDMDGIDVLRTIRRNDRLSTVPVIMLSGFADEEARIRALRAGADDFVAKPFSTRELVARIQSNVRMAQARRAAVWRESELLRLHQSQQELRKLLDTIQNVRADERRMLAREVHDQLGQVLTAAKIDIRLLEKQGAGTLVAPGDDAMLSRLHSARSSIDLAIASVQNISILLRPPALENGLVAALRWQAANVERRTSLACSVVHAGEGYVEPSQFVAGEMFRICQEALTNVVRHANASCVVISVMVRNGSLVLRVCDNGVGIPDSVADRPDAIGIAGMRERAASIRACLRVRGRKGRGTIVSIRRPVMLS